MLPWSAVLGYIAEAWLIHEARGLPAAAVCGTSHRLFSPPRAPWSLTRSMGFAHPITLTLQGVLQDSGASASAVSVTNAVTLRIE